MPIEIFVLVMGLPALAYTIAWGVNWKNIRSKCPRWRELEELWSYLPEKHQRVGKVITVSRLPLAIVFCALSLLFFPYKYFGYQTESKLFGYQIDSSRTRLNEGDVDDQQQMDPAYKNLTVREVKMIQGWKLDEQQLNVLVELALEDPKREGALERAYNNMFAPRAGLIGIVEIKNPIHKPTQVTIVYFFQAAVMFGFAVYWYKSMYSRMLRKFHNQTSHHEYALHLLSDKSRQTYEAFYHKCQVEISTIEAECKTKLDKAIEIQNLDGYQAAAENAHAAKTKATEEVNQRLATLRETLLKSEGKLDCLSLPFS